MDHRQTAKELVETLTGRLQSLGDQLDVKALVGECEALSRAIAAFHMEGIRFRIFNVDRLIHRMPGLPPDVSSLVADARRELEAAGFHTRSHQAPV